MTSIAAIEFAAAYTAGAKRNAKKPPKAARLEVAKHSVTARAIALKVFFGRPAWSHKGFRAKRDIHGAAPRFITRSALAVCEVVKEISIPEQRVFDGKVFPLALGPAGSCAAKWSGDDLGEWAAQNIDLINEKLDRYGAILLRGFATYTPQDFASVVESLGWAKFPYVGGNAVRHNVVGDFVFTANEAPPSRTIPFHHEMAQTRPCPGKVMFFCERAAESGGETPIVLSNRIYQQLAARQPGFLERLETRGVRYVRSMTQHDRPDSAIGRGWQSTFHVHTKHDLEVKLAAEGAEWEWEGEGVLKHISPVLPAVVPHGPSASKMFFNQIEAAYTGWRDEINQVGRAVTDGDGRPLDQESLEDVARISAEESVAFKWHAGDILLINNDMVLHSRSTFTGKRRVLASLAK